MKKGIVLLGICLLWTLPLSARDATISGDYLEVRTGDVYTGPCFANAEVNLTGKEGMLAWRVREGSWRGVSLDGLSVLTVVKSKATLGDPFAIDRTTKAIIVVDERASAEQRDALVDLAQTEAGDLLQDVVRVKAAPIEIQFGKARTFASLKAGDVVQLKTRALNHGDHICGNEEVYYPPLTEVTQAKPAFTLMHQFKGKGLNGSWSSFGSRGAFVGTFSR
jgi:hypothetical protein